MKEIIVISILCVLLSAPFPVFGNDANKICDNQIILYYYFEKPVINEINSGSIIYHRVELKDTFISGNPGCPSLPSRGTKILVPYGSKINNIVITTGEGVSLGSGFNIEPIGQPIPFSEIDNAPPLDNEAIYGSYDIYPGRFFTEVGTYNCKGYEILVGLIHPIQYIPKTGELIYYPFILLSIETVKDEVVNSLYRGIEKDRLQIIDEVDNPFTAYSYELKIQEQTFDYDLLIITTDRFKRGFEPLATAHRANGVNTIIKTLSDIGSKDPADLRDYILYAYNNFGIDYVLLGGDDNIIPVRYLYFGRELQPILGPSDLYYGCLDGTWNKPSISIPLNRDISITDSWVEGTGEGVFSSPIVDSNNYVKGDSSIIWTVVNTETQSGHCNLTFDYPYLDLSDMNWLNFNIRQSRLGYYINDVKIHCSDGREVSFSLRNSNGVYGTGFFPLITTKWTPDHVYLPHFSDSKNFDWKSVDRISFSIDGSHAKEKDTIGIDGLYFSDFCDDFYGEVGDDDLYAEVYVGRACVGNIWEVKNFVSKTVKYMCTEPDDAYLKKALLVGQFVGFGGEADWGGNYTDDIIDGSNDHNYTTVGIPSDKYKIDTLYDRDWKENGWPYPREFPPGYGGWPKRELIKRINKNVHLMDHMGHGKTDMAMDLKNSDVYRLRNNKYFFLYSMTCSAGDFDGRKDCFAEYITVKTRHGAFAAIMNARTGWAAMSTNQSDLRTKDCPAHRFHRQFWDAVFGENKTTIGMANQDSKEDNIYGIDESWMMRATYYQLNLFGDPAVELKLSNSNSIINS